MWLITWILKTAVNIATIPVSVASDVYNWVIKSDFESRTSEKLDKIWENLDDTFDWSVL